MHRSVYEALAHEEARLKQLDEERHSILTRIAKLHTQLAATTSEFHPNQESKLSPEAKVSLFRSLFNGREDVYPKMWLSKDGTRKGYMPACGNDGNYSLCGKRKFPRVKCADCDYQAYLPVTDETIRGHLQGKQTIGVYSLLPDDTCRFLAVDFDKTTWQEDVTALRETCTTLDLPVVVERSPSVCLPEQRIKGKLPKKITVVLAQRIFVENKSLPSELLNRIKRLAAFQNPEFYKKQKMRLSTHNTPRVIACFEETPQYIGLPRGCCDALGELLKEHGIQLKVDDKRQRGVVKEFTFHGSLTDIQQQAVAELESHDISIFVAPPGSGKTVVGANRH